MTCCFSGLSVGRARPLLQEIPGALLAFEMARRIRKAKRNELLLRLGTAKLLQQDGPGALRAFEEARRIREAQGILESEPGAQLLFHIGVVKEHLELPDALEAFESARQILESSGRLGTEAAVRLQYDIDLRLSSRLSPGQRVEQALEGLHCILAERRINALKQLGLEALSAPDLVAPYLGDIISKLADCDVRVRFSSAHVIEALTEHVHHQHLEAIESLISSPTRGPGVEPVVEHTLEMLGDVPGGADALRRLRARLEKT